MFLLSPSPAKVIKMEPARIQFTDDRVSPVWQPDSHPRSLGCEQFDRFELWGRQVLAATGRGECCAVANLRDNRNKNTRELEQRANSLIVHYLWRILCQDLVSVLHECPRG